MTPRGSRSSKSAACTYTRAVGNLANLRERAGAHASPATTGLGHTRWATHGGVTEENAHPLAAEEPEKLAIVLNGIVENYRELRERLLEDGHVFSSETDAETVTHLIEEHYDGDLVEAVRLAYGELEGHFAFVAIHRDHPGVLVGARLQCPMVVGLAEGETYVASNAAAFLRETRVVQFPDDGEVAIVTPEGSSFLRASDGAPVEHDVVELDWDDEGAVKGGYETFMLKEIHEQPDAVAETIGDRVRKGRLVLEGLGMDDDELRELSRIVILSAGTSYHAAVAARYAIEEWGRVPVEHDIASEWIYRNPVLDRETLVIGISQSGETRDTIEAMKLARQLGAHTVAITNMMGSQITREVDSMLYTRAGLEVSVAASKTFTAQLSLLFLVALKLAQVRETLSPGELEYILNAVYALPTKIKEFLDGDHPIDEIARRFHDRPFFLYLGRNIGLPVALEGALKLKEISYIPTEAYSAGEMKHGPIALLDESTPVVVVATRMDRVYDKLVSNIQEVRARGAHVIAIASDGNEDIQHHADDVIYVPKAPAFLSAVLAVVPLQLLAYRIARLRGLNVDQPQEPREDRHGRVGDRRGPRATPGRGGVSSPLPFRQRYRGDHPCDVASPSPLPCSCARSSARPRASAASSDLFFSEYVEGSGNNKALEIFNDTGAPVDLAAGGYNVQMFFNGSATAGPDDQPDGDRRERRRVRPRAIGRRPRDPRPSRTRRIGSGWFNGDDAVVLRKGTTVLDVIGQIGFDPGAEWGTGDTSTADNTLRRKPTIIGGRPERRGRVRPGGRVGRLRDDTFGGLGAHITAATHRGRRVPAVALHAAGHRGHGGGLRDGHRTARSPR